MGKGVTPTPPAAAAPVAPPRNIVRIKRQFSMPHINDAPNVMFDPVDPGRTEATVNCSLCTTAGLVTFATGTFVSSGQVARRRGGPTATQGNHNFGDGNEFKARRQLVKLKGVPQLDDESALHMDDTGLRNKTKMGAALAIDVDKTNQKQFDGIQDYCRRGAHLEVNALSGAQNLRSALSWMQQQPEGTLFGFLLENMGHWNVAEVVADESNSNSNHVVFIDFQTDHAELGSLPRFGPLPIEGVAGRVVDDMDTTVRVFAVTPASQSASAATPSAASAAAPPDSGTD